VGVKQGFSPRSKPFIPLKPGVFGKPRESGLNPRYFAPPEPSKQIFKEFDFEWIWKVAYVINVSLSNINTLD
jgi:hypothetical protein